MNRQDRRRTAKAKGETIAQQLARGFQWHQRGNLASAEAVFRKILSVDPDDQEAQRLLGEVLTDRGQFGEAVALLGQLVSRHPQQFNTHYALGNAYRLSGQNEAAIAAYQASLAIEPHYLGSLHGLGLALRNARREREALEHFRSVLRLKPDWAVVWKDLGLTLAILGDFPLAEAALRRAIALQPSLGDAHRHLAALCQERVEVEDVNLLMKTYTDPHTQAGE